MPDGSDYSPDKPIGGTSRQKRKELFGEQVSPVTSQQKPKTQKKPTGTKRII